MKIKKKMPISFIIIISMFINMSFVSFATTVQSQRVPYGNSSKVFSTFTGSYQYVYTYGNICYLSLGLSGGVSCKSLYESITLKDAAGVNNSPIIVLGANTSNITTNTSSFYDDSLAPYTSKGYYYYIVDSSNYVYGDSNVVWSKTVY